MGEGTNALPDGLTRRRVLAGGVTATAGAASVAAGCLTPIENMLGGPTTEQVSLEIKTLPADYDSTSTRIARSLANRLETVGIASDIVLMPPAQLQRDVLLNQNFEVYVGKMAIPRDPDFLRPLLHSRFSEDSGWSNPFGFTDHETDELLERQRHQTDTERRKTIIRVQEIVAKEQPFVPLVTGDAIAALGTERFTGWERFHSRGPMWLVGLEPAERERPTSRSLTIAITDPRPTEVSNPLRADFERTDIALELLYDPLARYYDGAIRPWLADSWKWDGTDLIVRLPTDLHWHDDEPLTPGDITFTYKFLSDTSLDTPDAFAPAPAHRAEADLVSAVEIEDDRTLRFSIDAARPTAMRALTVPLLPRHVWQSKTDVVSSDPVRTEALGWANPDPIGSGPLAFDARASKESMRLVRNDDHPLNREGETRLAERFGPLAISDLKLLVAPSDVTAVNHVDVGTADVTAATLGSESVERIDGIADVRPLRGPSRAIYHVGLNVRETQLRNPNFRRALARLFDKEHLAKSIFDGYARPLATPLIDDYWVAEALQWDGTDPEVPFVGTDGSLDVTAAREFFRDAGFRYTDDGQLIH